MVPNMGRTLNRGWLRMLAWRLNGQTLNAGSCGVEMSELAELELMSSEVPELTRFQAHHAAYWSILSGNVELGFICL